MDYRAWTFTVWYVSGITRNRSIPECGMPARADCATRDKIINRSRLPISIERAHIGRRLIETSPSNVKWQRELNRHRAANHSATYRMFHVAQVVFKRKKVLSPSILSKIEADANIYARFSRRRRWQLKRIADDGAMIAIAWSERIGIARIGGERNARLATRRDSRTLLDNANRPNLDDTWSALSLGRRNACHNCVTSTRASFNPWKRGFIGAGTRRGDGAFSGTGLPPVCALALN